MINKRELMEANLIRHKPTGDIKKVGWDGYFKEDDFSPIPLTPEILQQCGFKYEPCRISGADMWQGMPFWSCEHFTLRGKVTTSKGGTLALSGYINSQIKYLHQLQNLYFALTGEELPINNFH